MHFYINALTRPSPDNTSDYLGRDMKTSHQGMGISDEDYAAFKHHLAATLEKFEVPEREHDEVMAFIDSLAGDIVES